MGNKKTKPILFATLGYPGSGKTFFSRRFAKDKHIFHLNSDRLRLEMFPQPNYSLKENSVVFCTMDYIAEELLRRGISVLYDANSTLLIYRKRLQKIAKQQGANYLLLWFMTPTKVATERILKRKELKSEFLRKYHRSIDTQVMHRIKSQEEKPKKEPFVILKPAPYKKQKEVVEFFLKFHGK